MKTLLIPLFEINGTGSYPAGAIRISEKVTYQGTEYYVAQCEDAATVVGSIPYNNYLLTEAQAAKIVEIKAEAFKRITAGDWEEQRIKEQIALGLATEGDLLPVYQEQDIRDASNAAEDVVNACTTVDAVNAVTW